MLPTCRTGPGLLWECLGGHVLGAGRSGRAPSSVEVSRITAHLSCREKSVSSLAQGRGLLEECPGLETGNVSRVHVRDRKWVEQDKSGRERCRCELGSPCSGSMGAFKRLYCSVNDTVSQRFLWAKRTGCFGVGTPSWEAGGAPRWVATAGW